MLAVTTCLAGCGVGAEDVAARRAAVLDRAETVVRADLDGMLARAWAALDAIEAEPIGSADEPARFARLEQIRLRTGVDGLDVLGEDGGRAWAGRVVEDRPLPAGPPWARSFQTGPVRYHEGPFVRALTVRRGAAPVRTASATLLLDTTPPGDTALEAFEARWLKPLGLRSLRFLAPDVARSPRPEETDRRLVQITTPAGDPVMAVELRARGPEATRERMIARHDARVGALWLVLLGLAIVGAVAFIRRIPGALLRNGLYVVLTFLARQGLVAIDMRRFDAFASLFAPDRFSVETPLGWFASPADFALSSVAYLLITTRLIEFGRHVRPRGRAPRAAVTIAGPVVAAIASIAWMWVVEHAVFGGQTSFFKLTAIVPAPESALMLAALVACTATAYLVTAFALRAGAVALPARLGTWRRVIPAVVTVALVCIAPHAPTCPGSAMLVLPVVAALTAGRPGTGARYGLPNRILIVSVLATMILFPALWIELEARERAHLPTRLEELVERERVALEVLETTLAELASDAGLQAELRRTSEGFPPDGLALGLWMRSGFRQRGDPGVVTVLNADRLQKDRFALEPIPWNLVPGAAAQGPDRPDIDVEVVLTDRARAVVGRLRVRDEDSGDVLGYVVIALPNLLDLVLLDLVDAVSSPTVRSSHPLKQARGLQYATLHDGRVASTNDPTIARVAGGFGPPALESIPDERLTLAWSDAGSEGYARWSPERNAVIAVRRTDPTIVEVLLALARMLVVGVGLGVIVALVFALATLRRFRPQLHHKILLSYLVISVVPLVLLAAASARETEVRFEAEMSQRLHLELSRVRHFMERLGVRLFDQATSQTLARWAADERHDVLLYHHGELESASRVGLVDAELLSSRLPPEVYQATELEARVTIRREALYAGREAWIGYAPILDDRGGVRATVAVPLGYDRGRMQSEVAVTGSAMLAGYLLALVLVLVVGIYAARNLTRPLGLLAAGTKRVASGELDVELPGEGDNEIGELVRSFNAMTRDLRETTERAVQAEREAAWRRMARQVAHEIRNPLTPMRLMIQQLEVVVDHEPENARRAIRETTPVLLRQIKALQKIAGDFANFARLPKRDIAPVQLGGLVEHVTKLHTGAEGVTVESVIEPDLPPVVWDEEELRRVLLNLVGNAVQSIRTDAPAGEGRVTVSLSRSSRDGAEGVRIAVKDTGEGIPAEDLPRLFEPHFSTRTSGTGLGLAIVARIVEDLGGTIDVDSTVGTGSTFLVWMPAG